MLSISYWGQNNGWKLLMRTDRGPPIIYAEILHTQTEGLRESDLSVSHIHILKRARAHTHARIHIHRLLQRSPHWWLICLEGSLHFSSAHYARANEGDIHSALSFVTEQKGDGEEENDRKRDGRKETSVRGRGMERMWVRKRGEKLKVCMWLKAVKVIGNVYLCLCVCIGDLEMTVALAVS